MEAKRALVIISQGCEDIETCAPIDIMNRAGIEVTIASVTGRPTPAAYGSTFVPHCAVAGIDDLFDIVVIPGGGRNASTLAGDEDVVRLVRAHAEDDRFVAAICASPGAVLAQAAGLLKDRRATGDPTFNDRLTAGGATVTNEEVTVDGKIITAMGPGAAIEFGLTIIRLLGYGDVAAHLMGYWRKSF